jgi:hypothetical protein
MPWSVQLKEKGFARPEGFKLSLTAGLPKIHLLNAVQRRKKGKPLIVGHSNKAPHIP